LIVVDASALIDVVLRTSVAPHVETMLFAPGQTVHAPHLIDAEIAQVCRRFERSGEIGHAQGVTALSNLAVFPMQRYPHDLLLPRVWTLRHNLTAYDAMYVALAELLDATLITRDRRLAAAPVHHARVEVI
jgi:predicted nucleic acid-binding protein